MKDFLIGAVLIVLFVGVPVAILVGTIIGAMKARRIIKKLDQ